MWAQVAEMGVFHLGKCETLLVHWVKDGKKHCQSGCDCFTFVA